MVSDNRAKEVKRQLRQTYNDIAPHFDLTRRTPWPESRKFAESLPPKARILDIGCGNGRNSFYLAEKGFTAVGIDFSARLITMARNKSGWRGKSESLQFIAAEVAAIPFRAGSFDAALFIATLHHIPTEKERIQSLLEIERCLKPGGRALVSVWAREQELYRKLAAGQEMLDSEAHTAGFESGDVLKPWKTGSKTYLRYYHFFKREEFEALLGKSLLAVRDTFESANNHYAILEKSA